MTRALALAALFAAWIAAGLFGHDPWKPDEAYTFGLVYHILQSNDWLVPTLAGQPFVEKPPLFFWTAAFLVSCASATPKPAPQAQQPAATAASPAPASQATGESDGTVDGPSTRRSS